MTGIIFSQPVADLFSVVMSIVMFIVIARRLSHTSENKA